MGLPCLGHCTRSETSNLGWARSTGSALALWKKPVSDYLGNGQIPASNNPRRRRCSLQSLSYSRLHSVATLLNQAEALMPSSSQPASLAAYNLACIAARIAPPPDAPSAGCVPAKPGTLPSKIPHWPTSTRSATPGFTAWWAEVFSQGDAAYGLTRAGRLGNCHCSAQRRQVGVWREIALRIVAAVAVENPAGRRFRLRPTTFRPRLLARARMEARWRRRYRSVSIFDKGGRFSASTGSSFR